MKEIFVLEFMLTFDEMPLMYTKYEIRGQTVLYIRCSGLVVECLNIINMLQSTTRPLGQNTRYTELCVQYETLE